MDENLTREMVSDLECALDGVAAALEPLEEIAKSLPYIVGRLDDLEQAVLEVKYTVDNASSVASYDFRVAEILGEIKDGIHRLKP